MILSVRLNGTDVNPYEKYGLTHNPFPQIARAEVQMHVLHLQKLAGPPIPNCAYIRRHLEGWNQEFIDLCCDQFRKGQHVQFTVEFPE